MNARSRGHVRDGVRADGGDKHLLSPRHRLERTDGTVGSCGVSDAIEEKLLATIC